MKVMETKRNVDMKRATPTEVKKAPVAAPKKDEETLIREASYFLSQKGLSYDDLCWILAEKQLNVLHPGKASRDEIGKKAEEVFAASKTYEELCWVIAKVDVTKKI